MMLNALMLTMCLSYAADKDLDKLQGTWQMQKLVGRGKEIDGDRARAISYVFDGDSAKRLVNGVDRKDPGTIKIDASKKPAHIDLKPAKEGDPTMLGIFEIDGDTLKWCFSSKKRPEKFESVEGSDNILMIFKRVKK
jgi:uncharacterized protein (TIGR03067 family)